MLKYKIIGADQKEYGPVGVDEIRAWIQEGRANGQSLVRLDGGTDWQPLGTFPELAALLAAIASAPPPFSAVPLHEMEGDKNNRMAVAGFACSVAGILCCAVGVLSIVGIILSSIGLSQIRQNPRQGGKGLAVAGIIIGILGLILVAVGWLSFFMGVFQNLN
jgi:hypothetical protein